MTTAPTCSCPCRGCVAFHVGATAAPGYSTNAEELALALALTLGISDSLRSRGIQVDDEPGAGELAGVGVVLQRATALAQQLSELVDEPLDHELVDRVGASVTLLAADLAAVVGDRPRVS